MGPPLLFQLYHPMGTKLCAVSAVDADHRFTDLIVPEHSADETGIITVTAPDAFCGIKTHAPTIS
jgi:hypothetical protein